MDECQLRTSTRQCHLALSIVHLAINPTQMSYQFPQIGGRYNLDRWNSECYVNGKQSVTTRTYPEQSDADGLRIFYVGDVTARSMDV
jgi:hypothetical protein